MTPVRIVFWVSVGLLVYTQVGYAVLLAVIARLRPLRGAAGEPAELPIVSVIVPAYAEQEVIANRVANHRALDYPADRLELIVVCDGCDVTVTFTMVEETYPWLSSAITSTVCVPGAVKI